MSFKSNAKAVPAQSREFVLPSRGLAYKRKCPDFPQNVIVVPYSYNTEAVLSTNMSYLHKLAAIAGQVISNVPKGFDVRDLLSADLVAVMTLARGLTYGETYKFTTVCPECSEPESHSVKVPDDIGTKSWDYPDFETMEADMVVLLPHVKDRVVFRHLTIADEIAIETSVRATSKQVTDEARLKTGLGRPEILRPAYRIVSVGGGVPDSMQESIEYVAALRGIDKVALDKAMEEKGCGLVFGWNISCPKCQATYPVEVPMALDFFRGHS